MIGLVVEKSRTCAHCNTRRCTSKRNEKAINWFITPELYQTNSSSFFWQKRTKKKQPPSWASRLTRRKSATNKEITMNGIYAHCLFHQVKIKQTIRKKKDFERKKRSHWRRERNFLLFIREEKKEFPIHIQRNKQRKDRNCFFFYHIDAISSSDRAPAVCPCPFPLVWPPELVPSFRWFVDWGSLFLVHTRSRLEAFR